MAGSWENLSNSIGFVEPLEGWVKARQRARVDNRALVKTVNLRFYADMASQSISRVRNKCFGLMSR